MNNVFIPVLILFLGLSMNATCTDVVLQSTNLPLIVINTNGTTIVNDVKITAQMKIIFNTGANANHPEDAGNEYTGYVGIDIRGSYSTNFPQKSYSFETRDISGNNLNVSILGMPADNDWILTGNYNDKTFMRNTLAFNLFEKMGHNQPRTRLCEVILNNLYIGIYVLTEKIKQGKNRVNIAKLKPTDNAGDSLTGGYILKIDNSDGSDGWSSMYEAMDRPNAFPFFIYHYPAPDVITAQQKTYLQGFINSFNAVLMNPSFADPVQGYRAYINVASFIDYFIIGELSRNVDAYKKSSYFFKDKDSKGGLLNAGPVWDFDWAWKNINECLVNATDGSGWTYNISSQCQSWPVPPDWIVKLLTDQNFANELNTRYFTLRRNLISNTSLVHYIDSIHTLVNDAQVRHFQKWPVLGIADPLETPEVDPQPITFDGVIQQFKNWISTRLSWLDRNMPGTFIDAVKSGIIDKRFTLRLFPNPTHDNFVVESSNPMQKIELFASNGVAVKLKYTPEKYSSEMDISNLPTGFYIAKVTLMNGEIINTKIILE